MFKDRNPSADRRAARRRERAERLRLLDGLLRGVPTKVTSSPPLALGLTCVIAFPIVVVTMLVGVALFFVVWQLGAPDWLAITVELTVGLGGGVGLSFIIMVWIYRRLSPETRAVVFDVDEDDRAPTNDRDLEAASAALSDELGRADAALAPPDESQLSGPR